MYHFDTISSTIKHYPYLTFLSTSLLLDEAINIFRQPPPNGAIPELEVLQQDPIPAAEWEMDRTWQDTLAGLPDDFQMLECCVHGNVVECKTDHNLDKASRTFKYKIRRTLAC
ncbi:hypothetical protein NQ317_004517 [Molorchus minor]|uniref:Uncharacterized protein n=1 Tax=Molorchus minor TaxID=1323400 RepID=A0ABQ9JXB4_9CUCU|nr:hypothetical protein NQ317_004517 [Molorchus minor]